MLITLMVSTLIGVSASNWMMIWAALEVNTLAMCFLISKDTSKEKMGQSATINYFLVQVMSSVVILVSVYSSESLVSELTVMMMLVLKMGGWPSHLWYLKLITTLKMSMKSFLVIMTWQKILPVFLLLSMVSKNSTMSMVMLMALTSALIPMVKLSKKLNMKSIMALSSLNNNGWMMVSAMVSMNLFLTMLVMYSVTLSITLEYFKKMEKKNKSYKESPWVSMMVAGNLSGLPPMTMFWVKILVVQKAVEMGVPTEIIAAMILMACLMLYHYLWMLLSEIPEAPKKQQNVKKDSMNSVILQKISMVSCVSFLMIMVYSLNRKGSILMG